VKRKYSKRRRRNPNPDAVFLEIVVRSTLNKGTNVQATVPIPDSNATPLG